MKPTITIRDGMPFTETARGMHRSTVKELLDEITALRLHNSRLAVTLNDAATRCRSIAAEFHLAMMKQRPGGIRARECAAASTVAARCAREITTIAASTRDCASTSDHPTDGVDSADGA